MRVPCHCAALKGLLCAVMFSGPALADITDPLNDNGGDPQQTDVVSQGMRSTTGEIFSQGTMAESGPWAGSIYSQGMQMPTGQIYSQGTEVAIPLGVTWSQQLASGGCVSSISNCSDSSPSAQQFSPPPNLTNNIGTGTVLGPSSFAIAAAPRRDPIPEPATTLALLSAALVWFGLGWGSRRRKV